jgi:cold-inducible RNA-binding protein
MGVQQARMAAKIYLPFVQNQSLNDRPLASACTPVKKDRMKNIYVGNLDFNVSEDELRQAFAAYGQVENVTVLKDRDTGQPRGFGFVEMANDEEAEKAISAMNGYQLGSRALNVNEARPKTSGGGGGFSRGGGGGFGRGGGGGYGRGGGGGGRGGNRGGGGGGGRRY